LKKPKAEGPDFDLLVFVGRFQPPHLGHLAVIEEALRRAKEVLILVGSANRSRSLRDPFTFKERAGMLRAAIGEPSLQRCVIAPLNDHLYNDSAWIEEVQESVHRRLAHVPEGEKRVGIIGHSKDHTSYYLRVFPGYEAVDVPGIRDKDKRLINSTGLRDVFYRMLMDRAFEKDWKALGLDSHVPKDAIPQLLYALKSPDMQGVLAEARYVAHYREGWKSAPFPPTFNTVDAVVQCCGHVLMVLRGHQPGMGKFVLPGGFIGQDEPLLEACVRELQEETQIAVPRAVIVGSLQKREPRTFDDPHRSSRGRTITHAFRFDLADKALPKVKGGDDAAAAMWVPISSVKPEQCFEDHAFIIRSMLGVS